VWCIKNCPHAEPAMTDLKQRHGCLTAFLVLAIPSSALVALVSLLIALVGPAAYKFTDSANAPGWTLWADCIATVLSTVSLMAIFVWRKWGFYGVIASALLAMGSYLGSMPTLIQAASMLVLYLVGIGILFGVLQIGRDKKGWAQLE
jgi:hypothetical protein